MNTELDTIVQQLSGATLEQQKKLSFAGRGLKLNSEDDAKEIEREISEFKDLEALCLEGNTIGIDAAKAIARGLKNHPEFKRALWSDIFTGRMKTEIPPALKHLSEAMMLSNVKLVELDLSDNAFGPNGIRGVEDLLRSEVCFTLTTLKLNNNGLGTFGGKILSDCLLECYDKSCASGMPMGLKVFVSGRGRLENDGAKGMSAVFKMMGSLEHVAMPQNGIQYPGITELAAAFAHCKNLKHVNLNDNTFTAKGAKAMADALPHLQNLEVINFGDCLIRTEGAIHLAAALNEGHHNLKELILCGNEIQREGGISIASSISNKEHLEKVELGANHFGEDGVGEIKSLFESVGADAILDTLSDDEGSEIEDEEGDEEEEEESDGEKNDEDEVEIIPPVTANIEEDASITVSSFINEPSAIKLMKLGSKRVGKFVAEVKTYDSVEQGVRLLMKICSVVSLDDKISQKAAEECADGILSELFDSTQKKANERQMNSVNEILVQLGLLKSEDKQKVTANLIGILIVVEHAYRQSYFPSSCRSVLQTFLSKPDSNLSLCGPVHHRLMQTLYQY